MHTTLHVYRPLLTALVARAQAQAAGAAGAAALPAKDAPIQRHSTGTAAEAYSS
jgi:hypothetical protein